MLVLPRYVSCAPLNDLSKKRHGNNMRMSFTSTTSARITNSDDNTTELVAARPTPAAPPCVRIPWKHATSPMIRPNTIVLNVGGRKSLKSAPLKPALMNWCKETGSTIACVTQPMSKPQKSAARVSRGSIRIQARMRVAASSRYPDIDLIHITDVKIPTAREIREGVIK